MLKNILVLLMVLGSYMVLKAEENKLPVTCVNFVLNGETESLMFIVEETTQQGYFARLETNPIKFEIISVYDIATGKQKGGKNYELDLRTPQGIYQITHYRHQNTLHRKYGTGAFVLDYPNRFDGLKNRTGSGIWIHGTDRVDFIDCDSEGCVRLKNNDLLSVIPLLVPGKTQVVLVERIEWVTEDELMLEYKLLKKKINNWKKQWEQDQLPDYLANYHSSFIEKNTNRDIARWSLAKKNADKPISIDFSDERFYYFNGELLYTAKQQYKSKSHFDRGVKDVLWKKLDGDWYIVSERWVK